MAGLELSEAVRVVRNVLNSVRKVVVGKENLIKLVLSALFSEGHILIEGVPGTGKTLMAASIARAFGGVFKRVQGNPDILPTDITGFHVYSLSGEARFVKGPIFANVLMVDELNRITPRAQAALLEAMQEGRVTVDGVTYRLPRPFLIIATQMPGGMGTGTYPLTETLLDRFSAVAYSTYNAPEEEFEIVGRSDELVADNVESAVGPEEVVKAVESIRDVYVDGRVVKYIIDLVNYVRTHKMVAYGPSHRASIHLYRMSRVYAVMRGRDYVTPDDVKALAKPVMLHRFRVTPEAEAEGVSREALISEALSRVKVPKE
ncbi:MAG: ATPase [Desulfurococcales archaeon ex4484_204]|nr:MAG: ATPase [Desulfurococcales archaeon ex4484_204]